MSTTTIYARVPEDLKSATDAYAAEHGMTLANAVTDLLGRGIEASVNEESVKALESRAQELQRELRPGPPSARCRLRAAAAGPRQMQVRSPPHRGGFSHQGDLPGLQARAHRLTRRRERGRR